VNVRPMIIGRIRALAVAGSLVASSSPATALAAGSAHEPDLAQILARSAAARGGLEAWRKVRTMVWTGHVERVDASAPRLPFMLQQKRPNLTRFEIAIDRATSVRVFDGRQGWKQRPGAGGKPELEPYGEPEVRAAREALVIDGPLLDAAAKGVEVTLDGVDEVDGRKAYRLAAKLPSGTVQRVWIDAETFLEVKHERPGRDAAGRPTTVAVYLRNYQRVDGLEVPFTIETGTPGGGALADRLMIERVAINVTLPARTFARAGLHTSRRGVTVDTRPEPASPRASATTSR